MNMNPTAFRCRLPRSGGFTLIELLAVLGIMAILALATIPYAHLHQARLKEVQLRTALREIRSALDAYKRASDEGRVSRVADASGYPPDLRTLVDGVEDLRSPTRARLFPATASPRSVRRSGIASGTDMDHPQLRQPTRRPEARRRRVRRILSFQPHGPRRQALQGLVSCERRLTFARHGAARSR